MSGQEQDTSPVSSRFVQELERTGMTNQDAAHALGVSERQVTRWRGGQEPRYATVVQIARLFGRPVTWFYDDDQVAA